MRALVRLAVVLWLGGCASTSTTPRREKPMVATATRNTPWTLVYGDGSANVYRLSQASAADDVHFEYIPVTPAQSSTGHYSGGDPKQAQLPPADPRIEELWRRVAALESDPALRAAERAKRTGQLTITTPDGTRSFIIAFGPALTELDELLATFRR
jgi:hypothetical protein